MRKYALLRRKSAHTLGAVDASTATPRARAAWAYSRLKQPELAAKAGIHKDRLRAILAESNAKDVKLEELYAIADATDVPRDFMASGWATEDERVARLEDAQRQLEARLVVLEAEARGRTVGTGRSNLDRSR